MKYATFSKSAFAVTAILVATACANSADVPAEEAAPTDPAPTSTVPPAAKPTPPVEKKCAPSCKTDSDCQNSCPALPGGIQCCDTKAGACFGSKTSACPAPPPPPPVDPPPAY
ncbi:MAG TPA: hypothetical protein VLT33_16825 [Labilithrix sp.]|nr:hypothetical protein [Labilithrix sp.]